MCRWKLILTTFRCQGFNSQTGIYIFIFFGAMPLKRLFQLNTLDPFINLAIENWLMESKPKQDTYLLLWRNNPCVVIGRHQNPHRECNLDLMKQLSIPLVRRYSGGGAVYHDLGNSNYSLITDMEEFKRERACELVQRAMARLGVQLRISERWDLWMGEGKVSGSAFRLSRGRAYHHGTMLRETCLATLQNVLESKIKEQGDEGCIITSVKSPVRNTSVSHVQFCSAMQTQFKPDDLEVIDELPREALGFYEELRDEGWINERKPKNTIKHEPIQHAIKSL